MSVSNLLVDPLRAGPLLACLVCAGLGSACASDGEKRSTQPAEPRSAPSASKARAGSETTKEKRPDPHSFARPDQARVDTVALRLKVDFKKRVLDGVARLGITKVVPGVDEIVLDTYGLSIVEVNDGSGAPLDYAYGAKDDLLGQPLHISLEPDTKELVIVYQTSPEAAALQWLTPELTVGKKHPYLFTQGQAILTRTWVPLQDSPGVRVTYEATIEVPAGLTAIMSAERKSPPPGAAASTTSSPSDDDGSRSFQFVMEQPIPPYLMALAVGDLAYRELGPRTGVWAEPAALEGAAAEFSDVEQMMSSTEKLYGPYRWGRYEILVLPPSFPFGGMENPRLTFLSPTVIAGDKSLVSVVAHELAHSWSGNLVTNATWADFWLNEGFTTYIENRILEEIYGVERARLVESLGRRDLLEEMAELGADHPGTSLHQKLDGKDPDDSITSTPYDKGMAFLRMLELEVGRAELDAFLKRYFDDNAFQSMTTKTFAARLRSELLGPRPGLEEKIGLERWLYQPGPPDNLPPVASGVLEDIQATAQLVAGGQARVKDLDKPSWGPLMWVIFMRELPRQLPEAQRSQILADLDEKVEASTTGNSEIRFEWLKLVIENRHEPGFASMEQFLLEQGRRRLVRPLYEKLVARDWGQPMAQRIYDKARSRYHPLTVQTIDAILAAAGGPQGAG